MVQDSTNYGIQYKDGALRETPLAVSQSRDVKPVYCFGFGTDIGILDWVGLDWTGLD